MDDTTKVLLAIFVLLAIGIFVLVALNLGAGGAASSVSGALSGAPSQAPAYLPGTIGRGCGI